MIKLTKIALCTSLCLSMLSVGASAKTVLEVASWKGSGSEVANFPAIIERFEKENPDIEIKLNYMARNDMVTSIPARMQAGTPPDVVMIDGEFMQHWGGNDQLMPLNGEDFISRMQPGLIPAMSLGDNIYYSMLQMSGMGVYVNDDLFEKAGVEQYPNTVDELIQTCEKLNDKGITPMLMAANNGGWTPYVYFLTFALSDGNQPDPERLNKFVSGELKFSDDVHVKNAFESFKRMIKADCFSPKVSAGTDPWSVALTSFQSSRVAMLPQGLWNVTPFMNDGLPENFSLHPFPNANGDKPIVMDYNGPGWSIPKTSKHVEEAKKWIDFWIQDENLKLYLEADKSISTLKNGSAVLPDLAKPYLEARDAGGIVTFPAGNIPPELGSDMTNDIVSFMLDSDQDYTVIMKRWDAITEKLRNK